MTQTKPTGGKWYANNDGHTVTGGTDRETVFAMVHNGRSSNESANEYEEALKICKAYNGTWNAGINPEAVPAMLEALKAIYELPATIGYAYRMQELAKAAINAAKL